MPENVKMWRYVLPSIGGEGWGIVVIDSTGFFAAVSDYGNYGYLWSHHGRPEFRDFITDMGRDTDYFLIKLSPGKEYDGVATEEAVRAAVADFGGEEEDVLLADSEFDTIIDFAHWLDQTQLQYVEAHELARYSHPSDVRAFCSKLLPRLAAMVRAELDAERGPT